MEVLLKPFYATEQMTQYFIPLLPESGVIAVKKNQSLFVHIYIHV